MLRHQHPLTEPGVHRLSSLLAPVNHCLPMASPESPDTDDSASTDRYHQTVVRSSRHQPSDHRISDPDNDDIADKNADLRTRSPVDDVGSRSAAADIDLGNELPSIHSDDDDDDDNDVTEAKQGDVSDDPGSTVKAALSPATRRRLLEMLPDLMSAANYKRLVDEGHVVFPDEDEQIDVITHSPSLNEERQDKYENAGDVASRHPASQTSEEVTPQSSQGDDRDSKREGFTTSSFDPCLESTLLLSVERGQERPAVYACHICDFLCKCLCSTCVFFYQFGHYYCVTHAQQRTKLSGSSWLFPSSVDLLGKSDRDSRNSPHWSYRYCKVLLPNLPDTMRTIRQTLESKFGGWMFPVELLRYLNKLEPSFDGPSFHLSRIDCPDSCSGSSTGGGRTRGDHCTHISDWLPNEFNGGVWRRSLPCPLWLECAPVAPPRLRTNCWSRHRAWCSALFSIDRSSVATFPRSIGWKQLKTTN